MLNHKLRWGVLSTANIGRAAVIPAIQHSANGEVVAVASRDEQKSHDFAAKAGIGRSYGSYEALLASSDIDAVYIPLPNSLHRAWTIKAAEAGKHVLCEKPLALNAVECAEMETAARRHNVLLMEAFMYRFHPQTEKVLALLHEGAIGEVRLIHSAFTFRVSNPANIRLQPQLGGGSLMDVGCYCVNLSRTLAGAQPQVARTAMSNTGGIARAGAQPQVARTATEPPRIDGVSNTGGIARAGQEPVEVQATANWSASGVDAQMAGWLRFGGQDASNALLATFDCALTLERREYYDVAGTEGSLLVPAAFLPGTGDTTIRLRQGRNSESVITVGGVDEYRLMVEHFADCVLNGRPLRYAPSEAANNMRVIEALYRSARNGARAEVLSGEVL
jgi:D-xylose 1-dehydrogenase (NADP+, D-xylono-1,5-lactone-forming)